MVDRRDYFYYNCYIKLLILISKTWFFVLGCLFRVVQGLSEVFPFPGKKGGCGGDFFRFLEDKSELRPKDQGFITLTIRTPLKGGS